MARPGPQTPEARAAVSRAHTLHGLRSRNVVLEGIEDPDEWIAFRDEVVQQCGAVGAVQVALAARVAECLWRLRRVNAAEYQCVAADQYHRDVLSFLAQSERDADPRDGEAAAAHAREVARALGEYAPAMAAGRARRNFVEALPVVLPASPDLDRLIRYEAHLSRQLGRALHELQALQDRQAGRPAPLARIDIG